MPNSIFMTCHFTQCTRASDSDSGHYDDDDDEPSSEVSK